MPRSSFSSVNRGHQQCFLCSRSCLYVLFGCFVAYTSLLTVGRALLLLPSSKNNLQFCDLTPLNIPSVGSAASLSRQTSNPKVLTREDPELDHLLRGDSSSGTLEVGWVRSPSKNSSPDIPTVVIAHFNEALTWLPFLGGGLHVHVVHKAHFPRSSTLETADAAPASELLPKLQAASSAEELLELLETAPESSRLTPARFLPPTLGSTLTVSTISNEDGWGRECSAYLYYIVKYYDRLPRRLAFLQGVPFLPSASPLDGTEEVAWARFNDFRQRLFRSVPQKEHPSNFMFTFVNPWLFRRCFARENWQCCHLHNDAVELLQDIGINFHSLSQGPGLFTPLPGCEGRPHVTSATSAQFVVESDLIRRLPRSAWVKVLRYTLQPVRYPTSDGRRNATVYWPQTNCHVLEHLWHVLMGRLPNHYDCPSQEPPGISPDMHLATRCRLAQEYQQPL